MLHVYCCLYLHIDVSKAPSYLFASVLTTSLRSSFNSESVVPLNARQEEILVALLNGYLSSSLMIFTS